MPEISLEEKRRRNREAQRKYRQSEKGKIATRERVKKWTEKKKSTDPKYFKKYKYDRSEYCFQDSKQEFCLGL